MQVINHTDGPSFEQGNMRGRNWELLTRTRSFVSTPTAGAILKKLEFAKIMAAVVPIGGRPGVGKTKTLKHFAASTPGVWYCRFSPDTTSVYAVLSEIAGALGLHDLPAQPAPVRRAIVDRLARVRALLICDEAQHLTTKGFEEVRSLFDHMEEHEGLGIVFAGHLDLLDKIAALPQLAGRATAELRITEAKAADVDALLEAWDFDCTRSRRFLRQFPGHKTGLRRIANALANAIRIADAMGEDVAFEHIERAWRAFDGRTESK